MAGRPVRISIIANGRTARAELQRTGNAVTSLNRTISRSAKIVGGAFAVGTIIRAGRAILANGDAYTSQLNKIEALTTAQQRAQVGGITGVAKALEANKGAYARYGNTIGDAAGGLTELVKAGQTLPQALKSVNATLVLAKAGEMDVADASGLVATALKDFRMPAKRAGDIANYLANAANISTSDVTDLGEALKFVGPVAHDTGISAQQTAAFLAQLSNAGIKGTMAGEGLRRVMLSLQSPTGKAKDAIKDLGLNVFDAQGKARPFAAVLTDMSKKLEGLTDQQRKADLRAIFGLTGVTSAQVLLDNVNTLDQYTKGVERAGAAQKLAQANSKGLMGTLRRAGALLQSSGQQAYRAFSPLVDKALRPMVDALEKNNGAIGDQVRVLGGRAVPLLKAFGDAAQSTAEGVRGAAEDLKPFVPLIGKAVDAATIGAKAFAAIPGPIKTLAIEAGLASLVLPRLTAGVTSVTSSVGFNIARLKQWRAELTYTETRAGAVGAVTSRLGSAMKGAAGLGGMLALSASAGQTNKSLAALERIGGGAALGFSVAGPWGAAIGGTVGLLGTLKTAFHKSADAAAEAARVAGAKDAWASAKRGAKELTDALHGTIKAYNDVTAAAVQQGFRDAKGQLLPWVKNILDAGVSMDTLTRATLGQTDAQRVLDKAQGRVGANLLARKGMVDQATAAFAAYNAELRKQVQAGTPVGADQAVKQQQLADAVKRATNAYKDYKAQVDSGNDALRKLGGAVTGHKAQMATLARQLGVTRKEYAQFPKEVRTQFEAGGVPQTKTQIKDLARQYQLTPRQIISVFKAAGIAISRADAKALGIDYKKLPKGVHTAVTATGTQQTGSQIKGLLRQYKLTPKQVLSAFKTAGIGVSKADAKGLGIAYNKVPKAMRTKAQVTGVQQAIALSHTFGTQAGSSWGAGYAAGVSSWVRNVAFRAAQVAAAAHAAAMREQQSHSPSKKMEQVGKWFSQGFAIGIRKDASKVLDAVEEMYDRIDKAQTKILSRAPKGQKARLRRQFKQQDKDVRSIVKAYSTGGLAAGSVGRSTRGLFTKAELRDGKIGLRDVAAAQQRVNEQLTNAQQALVDAKQAWRDYFDSVKTAVVAFGDVTQVGKNGAGNATADGIVKGLQVRKAAVEKYVHDIEVLRRAGLNGTALQQILDAGVDGGLQTADALVAGGQRAVNQVNSIQSQIDKAAGSLATSMANRFKLAGVQAAAGLVAGLQADQKGLARVAETLADGMVKAIKRKLQIKSPSRVFKQIGRYSVQGLRVGMDGTYVTRTGEMTAAALTKGFGTPALNAMASNSLQDRLAAKQAQTLRVTLSAPERDALLRGRDVQLDIALANSSGARTLR